MTMEHERKEESKRHVIEKIRRISVAMDRGEARTLIFLSGLFVIIIAGLLYFFFL